MSTRTKILTLSLAAVALAGVLSPSPVSAESPSIVVSPGESIQAAIDLVSDHATVIVAAGTYAENLLITKPITLVGEGATLVPPAVPVENACSSSSPEDELPGLCILGDITIPGPNTTPIINAYLGDVRVAGIRVTGFPGEGVFAYATDRLVVAGTELDHNGEDGAITLASHRTAYIGNYVHDNGIFGLTIEDAPAAQATVAFNRVAGNSGTGILVRDSDQATVTANVLTENCAGILAVQTYAPTDDLSIRFNRVTANNRFCPANADGYPAFSGIGIGLIGADASLSANRVTGHVPAEGTDLPSGNIVQIEAP